MKINKTNSKKYFRESIFPFIPRELIRRNSPLVKKAIKILESYIPSESKSVTIYKKYDLGKHAWNELINFLKNKEKLDKEGIAYVKFIEQEVLRFASYRQEHTKQAYQSPKKYNENEEILLDYRQKSPKGVTNTCCYLCGKALERHITRKNLHCCTREENLICYKSRKSLETKEKRSWRFFINKNRELKKPYCAKCNKLITYSLDKNNYFYKGLPFCCQKHRETYRKSEFRNQKKLKILSPKTF